MSKRLILYADSNFSAKIDHVVSIDKVIGIFFLGGGGGGGSVMLVTSKLCNDRAYSHYALGVP